MDVLVAPNHPTDLLRYMHRLYQGRQLCDLILLSQDDVEFYTHRIVMSASSEYLHILFTTQTPIASSIRLDLPSEALQVLIEFMYTGQLAASQQMQQSLLHAAQFLKIPPLERLLSVPATMITVPSAPEVSAEHPLGSQESDIADELEWVKFNAGELLPKSLPLPPVIPSSALHDIAASELPPLDASGGGGTNGGVGTQTGSLDGVLPVLEGMSEQKPSVPVAPQFTSMQLRPAVCVETTTRPVAPGSSSDDVNLDLAVSSAEQSIKGEKDLGENDKVLPSSSCSSDINQDTKTFVAKAKSSPCKAKASLASSKHLTRRLEKVSKLKQKRKGGSSERKKHPTVRRGRQSYGYLCHKCKLSFSSHVLLKCHNMLQHGHGLYGNVFRKYVRRKYLNDHFLRHACDTKMVEEGRRKFTCNLCHEEFIFAFQYRHHYGKNHTDRSSNTQGLFCLLSQAHRTKKSSGSKGKTSTCTNLPSAASKLKTSAQKKTTCKTVCEFCNKPFATEKTLREHLVKIHNLTATGVRTVLAKSQAGKSPLTQAFQCVECLKCMGNLQGLNRHLQHIHKMDSDSAKKRANDLSYDLNCTVGACRYVTQNLGDMSDHMLSRHPLVQHCCNDCDKKFRVEALLERHVSAKHAVKPGPKRLSCLLCNKKYQKPYHLRVHEFWKHNIPHPKIKQKSADSQTPIISGRKKRRKQAAPIQLAKQYRRYSSEALLNAYAIVKQGGISVNRAAQMFQVPAQTLRDRVKGTVNPNNFVIGGESMFSREEEEAVMEHVETMSELGYEFRTYKLKVLAGELAHAVDKRPTSKALSNNWLYSFQARWKERMASLKPLCRKKAKCASPEAVDLYFENLQEALEKFDLQDKPEFVYSLDEFCIQSENGSSNVIEPVEEKLQAITSSSSANATLIGCSSAVGDVIPPFFVFKGKKINPDVMKGASPNAKCATSESGLSNMEVLSDYLEHHFLPHVRSSSVADDQEIVLILDGHASRYSISLIDWAGLYHLNLVVLPAHASHLLQPLDVSVLGPFKDYYESECASFMTPNIGQVVTNYQMCELGCNAYTKAMVPYSIKSGFKRTGIVPLNRKAVPKKLTPRESCQRFYTR